MMIPLRPLRRAPGDARVVTLLQWLAEDCVTSGDVIVALMQALTRYLDTIPPDARHPSFVAVQDALAGALDAIAEACRMDDLIPGDLPRRH